MTKFTLFLSFLLVFSLQYALKAQSTINKAEINFTFVSKDVTGTIEGFESSSTIDFDNPENSVFKGAVAVETLDTNNGLRNWSLKSGKYFDADAFPKISFESTAVIENENNYEVKGNLTLKGVTRPITIVFSKKGNQLKGLFEIYSSDFGIKIKKKREENLVKVTLLFYLK